METFPCVDCPICGVVLQLSEPITDHDCPDDVPECEHHWNVWLSMANGQFDDDAVFPNAPKPSYVFRIHRTNGHVRVQHIFEHNERVVGTCECGVDYEWNPVHL